MQEPDGSLLSKVAVTGFQSTSPPSADATPRYYGAASTRSTLTGADVFARAAILFAAIGRPETDAFAGVLRAAAIQAWDWVEANPAVFFDNVGFSSAHPDGKQTGGYSDYDDIAVSRARAAAKLLVLTGEDRFRTFFNANYQKAHLFAWSFAYVFESGVQDGILYYLRAGTGTDSVKANIRSAYTNALKSGSANLPAFTGASDPYRSHLDTNNYTWGSNSSKAKLGNMYRAMTLADFGVSDTATDPVLTIYDNATNPATVLATNDDWGAFADQMELAAITEAVGAFPLSADSRDAAMVAELAPGLYSAKTENGSGSSGVAIVEVYDAEVDRKSQRRLANLSCRALVGRGDRVLIPVVAVLESETATLLVRAVGPGVESFGSMGCSRIR